MSGKQRTIKNEFLRKRHKRTTKHIENNARISKVNKEKVQISKKEINQPISLLRNKKIIRPGQDIK